VPFFFLREGKIKERQQNKTPISNLDLYPTLLDVAGIEKPETLHLDGENFLPLLIHGQSLSERPLFWHFPIYLQAVTDKNENRDPKFRTRPGSVVRYGDWKLHHYFEDGGIELYNLKNDIGERNDLAERKPKKTKELMKLLDDWRTKTDAPVPKTKNPEFVEEN